MKLFLAPIQGMTTAFYRNTFAKYFGGIDAYYAPFISISEMKKVNNLPLKDILPENNDASVKLVPQLLGNNGEQFRSFACAITDMGYTEINWNIGCPAHTVTKKKKGSGILPYPDIIKKVLDAACSGNGYTVTVKMRLGLHDTEDGIRVMGALNEYPLGGVIIHARTGIQMYNGNVDLDAFESVASLCKHEVTYNGDIFTNADFKRISSRFPSVHNYMLGRGVLRNPFLPSAIKGQEFQPADKIIKIRKLHDEIYEHYKNRLSGDKHLCDKMKEFWEYMHIHIDKEGKLVKKIRKCRSAEEYLEAANLLLYHISGWTD